MGVFEEQSLRTAGMEDDENVFASNIWVGTWVCKYVVTLVHAWC